MGSTENSMLRLLPVLMYHCIRSPRCPVDDGEELRYSVPLGDFRAQMSMIAARGLRGVSIGQALAEGEGGRGLVALTFDDGNESDYIHALPLLRELDFRATFFVCLNRIGVRGGVDAAMLAEMTEAGMEVGSHGVSHRFFNLLSEREQRDELVRSREELEGMCRSKVVSFSAPGGRLGASTERLARELGYRALCTSRFGFNTLPTRADFHRFNRIAVTTSLGPGRFAAAIEARRTRLLSLYLRHRTISCMRSLLGEGSYARLRNRILGADDR